MCGRFWWFLFAREKFASDLQKRPFGPKGRWPRFSCWGRAPIPSGSGAEGLGFLPGWYHRPILPSTKHTQITATKICHNFLFTSVTLFFHHVPVPIFYCSHSSKHTQITATKICHNFLFTSVTLFFHHVPVPIFYCSHSSKLLISHTNH